MAFTPGQGLKITPSNSPYYRPGTKSPIKPPRTSSETVLSLRQIIGTTTTSPNGFDCRSAGRCFAYTAGAAAVVVKVDEEYKTSQRFFRARPNAAPLSSAAGPFNPSTPTQNIDNRNRLVSSIRDAGLGISPGGGGSPITEWGDSPLSKTWSSKERIKAATCVSFSPDGRHLAVGEVSHLDQSIYNANCFQDGIQSKGPHLFNSAGLVDRHSSRRADRTHFRNSMCCL
jgi:hypothetical protein